MISFLMRYFLCFIDRLMLSCLAFRFRIGRFLFAILGSILFDCLDGILGWTIFLVIIFRVLIA